jgi:hypothetical protein
MEYFDGYTYFTAEGKFTVGAVRAPADIAALPSVDETVMVRKPEFEPQDWADTKNETRVKYTDSLSDWKEDAKTHRDRGNFAITGEFASQTLDRSWVTLGALAQSMADGAGRAAALPQQTGRLTLRKTSTLFPLLTPGALFRLNYPPRAYRDLVCRVTERSVPSPARPEFSVALRIDRAYLTPTGTSPAPGNPSASDPVLPPQITAARVVETPLELCLEGALCLSLLVARPDSTMTAVKLHLGKNYNFQGAIADPESYELYATLEKFASRGVATADYPKTTPLIDEALGLAVQLDGPDNTLDEQTPFDSLADDLLVFIDDEIMSVHKADLAGTGLYRLYCVRNRFATVRQDHLTGAEVFIVPRSALRALSHPHFDVNNTAVFKLQTVNGVGESDLASALRKDKAITGLVYKSTTPTNLRVNSDGQNPSYSTGQGITIDWTLTAAGRDLYQARLLKFSTLLEFLDGGLNVLGTQTLADGVATLTLSNGQLVAILGSEVSFTLRAKTKVESDEWILYSANTDLFVRKV